MTSFVILTTTLESIKDLFMHGTGWIASLTGVIITAMHTTAISVLGVVTVVGTLDLGWSTLVRMWRRQGGIGETVRQSSKSTRSVQASAPESTE
jgi:hypothetical protein